MSDNRFSTGEMPAVNGMTQFFSNAVSHRTVLAPDRNETDWWAGAPSVVRAADGTFYLAARMREGQSPRGQRGYEVRILRSDDGVSFEPYLSIPREQAGVMGFERPSLVIDPASGRFRLYACTAVDGPYWGILKFDDVDDLKDLDLGSLRTVLAPTSDDGTHRLRTGYKDPTVFHHGDRWHMYVIGHDFVERVHHFISDDGESWRGDPGNPVFDNAGWHNFFTRPACMIPNGLGWLAVYEGSSSRWYDPGYNIATGLAYTFDLSHFIDLTPDHPLLISTTPGDYHTWRYSCWVRVGNAFYIYAETARPNTTNEIRLFVIDADRAIGFEP